MATTPAATSASAGSRIMTALALAAAADPRLVERVTLGLAPWALTLPPAARRQMLDQVAALLAGAEDERVVVELDLLLTSWQSTAASFAR